MQMAMAVSKGRGTCRKNKKEKKRTTTTQELKHKHELESVGMDQLMLNNPVIFNCREMLAPGQACSFTGGSGSKN